MTDKRTHRRTVLYRNEVATIATVSAGHYEQWTVRAHEGTDNVYIDFTRWIPGQTRHTDVMATDLSQDEAERIVDVMVASRLREGYEEEGLPYTTIGELEGSFSPVQLKTWEDANLPGMKTNCESIELTGEWDTAALDRQARAAAWQAILDGEPVRLSLDDDTDPVVLRRVMPDTDTQTGKDKDDA